MKEKEFVDLLEKRFNLYGWTTWREEIPDQCKKWSKPWRVDLIAYKKEIGYIGIEAKSIGQSQGGVIGKGHKQIQKYRNLTYFNGKEVLLWAIALKFSTKIHPVETVLREFFCSYGIGWVYHDYQKFCEDSRQYVALPEIDFGYSQGWAKIPLDLSRKKMDVEKIIIAQQKKGDEK